LPYRPRFWYLIPMRENPFRLPGRWLRTAIHVHTTRSDGRVSPAEALRVYAAAGYDAMIFGDHERVTVPADAPDGMLVIPGAEWAARFADEPAGMHFMAVGMRDGEAGKLARLKGDPYALAEALSGLCDYLILAHPYWSALTAELIARLPAMPALEVYNHGCELEDALGGSWYVWDQLLARGHRWDAVAVDDAHWRIHDSCAARVMVKAPEATVAEVIAALKAGLFYSTTGPEILDLEFLAPRHLAVTTTPAAGILFRCNGSLGSGLHAADGEPLTRAEHKLPDRARFVRVEVTDLAGRKAWTNPFYLDG